MVIKKKMRKSISLVLALVMFVSGLYIKGAGINVEADVVGDSAGNGASGTSATGGYSVSDDNLDGKSPVGFRFRLVRGKKDESNPEKEPRIVGNLIDVYKNKPTTGNVIIYGERKSKAEWAEIFNNSSFNGKNLKYKEIGAANNIFGNSDLNLDFDVSEFESNFSKDTLQAEICNKMKGGKWSELKTQYIITAEPIHECTIEGKTVYATSTDLAVIYYKIAGDTASSSTNGNEINFIGNPIRRYYPVALYVPENRLVDDKPKIEGIVGVAKPVSYDTDGRPTALSCTTIIKNSYGVGMIYSKDYNPNEPTEPKKIKIQYKVDPGFYPRNYEYVDEGETIFNLDPSDDKVNNVAVNKFRVILLNNYRTIGAKKDENKHYVYDSDGKRLSTVVEAGGFAIAKSGKNGMKIRYDNYHHTGWKVLDPQTKKLQGNLIEDGGEILYKTIKGYEDENGVVTLQSVPEINKCYIQYKSDEKAEINNGENNGYGWSNTGYFITKNGNIHTTAINADKLNETKDDYYKWPGASSSVSLSTFDLKSGQWRKFDKWTDGEKRQNNENGEFVNGGTFTLSDSQRENARKSPSSSGSAGNVGWIVNPIRKYYPIALYAPENDKDARVHDLVGVADKVSYDGTYEDGSDKNHITNLFTKQGLFLTVIPI